jgi:hypothetical protein
MATTDVHARMRMEAIKKKKHTYTTIMIEWRKSSKIKTLHLRMLMLVLNHLLNDEIKPHFYFKNTCFLTILSYSVE